MKTAKLHPLCVAVTAALLSAHMSGALADQVVRIGFSAPLTGGSAHAGKDQENGARLAIEEINANGLVIGGNKVTLELDSQDDAGDPRTATQVAQKLADDKVVEVIGHMNSGTSIPASKIKATRASSRSRHRRRTRSTRCRASGRRIASSRPIRNRDRHSPPTRPTH
jgi:branched-chain amino acid transport system substrate-binding protein